MKKTKPMISKFMKKCWKNVSFKDKGLLVLIIIFMLQSIHNLYTIESTNPDYVTVNIIVRTGIASIFGYFLSNNFLIGTINDEEESKLDKLERISKTLKEENLSMEKKLEVLSSTIEECEYIEQEKQVKDNNDENNKDYKKERRYLCNKILQSQITVGIALVISIVLIIGIDFNFIKGVSGATISQFRDLINGSIGFLIGSPSNNRNIDKD